MATECFDVTVENTTGCGQQRNIWLDISSPRHTVSVYDDGICKAKSLELGVYVKVISRSLV